MSNVQKAEEAAERVIAHMESGGTYTVQFSFVDGSMAFKAARSDGAEIDDMELFALIGGAGVAVEDEMNAMEKGA